MVIFHSYVSHYQRVSGEIDGEKPLAALSMVVQGGQCNIADIAHLLATAGSDSSRLMLV